MSSVPVGHAVVGGEPLPRVSSTSSCRAKAVSTTLAATVRGKAARGLLGSCLWADSPGVAGRLAASSRPRLPYSGVSLVPVGAVEWIGAVAVRVSADGPIESRHLPGEILRCPVETGQEGILREIFLPYQSCLHLCTSGF